MALCQRIRVLTSATQCTAVERRKKRKVLRASCAARIRVLTSVTQRKGTLQEAQSKHGSQRIRALTLCNTALQRNAASASKHGSVGDQSADSSANTVHRKGTPRTQSKHEAAVPEDQSVDCLQNSALQRNAARSASNMGQLCRGQCYSAMRNAVKRQCSRWRSKQRIRSADQNTVHAQCSQ
jgi:hypothetical protein